MGFFKNNWIYIVIAFAVVFLGGIGYVTYSRLNALTVRQPAPTPAPQPTEQPASEVELSFQITPAAGSAGLSCIELVATPLEGAVPLTVSFTGLASDTSDKITFNFDFGDSTNQSVAKEITSSDGIATQLMTHTYTKAGNYHASLTVASENGEQTSTACTIDITTGGVKGGPTIATIPTTQPTLIAQGPTTAPTSKPTTSVVTAVPTSSLSFPSTTPVTSTSPTPSVIPGTSPTSMLIAQTTTTPGAGNPTATRTPTQKPSLTKLPTSTPTITSSITRVPTPTRDIAVPNVPEAGNSFPTALAALGGLAIVGLAFFVIKSAA